MAIEDEFRQITLEQVANGVAAGFRQLGRSRQLRVLFESLAADAVPDEWRVDVHRELGEAARAATLDAYRSRAHNKHTPDYRSGGKSDPKGKRFAGGLLERALARKSFYRATKYGIEIINARDLDEEAQQWRRLNFGAGSAAGQGPRVFTATLFNAAIGLEPDPRPGFSLPPGYWLTNGPNGERVRSGGQFYPVGGREMADRRDLGRHRLGRPSQATRTRGIEAANFLDAGVRSIADNIGPMYLDMYRKFYNSPVGKKHFETIKVRAPQPRIMKFKSND